MAERWSHHPGERHRRTTYADDRMFIQSACVSAHPLQRLVFGITGCAARLGWVQAVDDFEDVQASYRDFARDEVELSACYGS